MRETPYTLCVRALPPLHHPESMQHRLCIYHLQNMHSRTRAFREWMFFIWAAYTLCMRIQVARGPSPGGALVRDKHRYTITVKYW